MTTVASSPESERGAPRGQAVMELLSSMRFAISLLTIICIASVIGTVLKQHEPHINYVNQFGPFWAELFTPLQLNAFRAGARNNNAQMTGVAAKMNDMEIKAVSDYIAGLR